MEVGDRITVIVNERPRHAYVISVDCVERDRFTWETKRRRGSVTGGNCRVDEEGMEWVHGHDPEAVTAMLAARALRATAAPRGWQMEMWATTIPLPPNHPWARNLERSRHPALKRAVPPPKRP